ncbi:hypothetical protein A2671_02295 [Candidatus Kaiserbacteria bacterium RIFCSPHIGHO2_01_FULL_49_13]|uniref:Transcription regulator TrmB N-terminal domain-containing protein n=1 Tax=Candidatus Kaiserbacteria bacterium RIFCSPHIGHO2_01_FULL_49_13 TaxID=1798477 RepID=A0A1F6CEN4_9BACT|nr:MAG: hypothetical protein A2671_02295 [Candidatus Kaiserbacteria bacterium RIFCSPHIGHO2_01_FULL_49_13]
MPPIIAKVLKEIGLSDKEAVVFLVLLERGPTLVSSVAQIAKLNRTTTYGIIKELVQRGLVSSVQKQGATRYQSIAPELLPGYIERRREELAENKKNIEKELPQIELLRNKRSILPKIQFHEGAEGVMAVYDDHLATDEPYEMLGFADLDQIVKFLPQNYLTKYMREKEKRGIKVRGIFADSELARKYTTELHPNTRESMRAAIHYLPKENFPFKGEITAYGKNKVSIINLKEDQVSALVVADESFYEMMKVIFELAWNGTSS